jgi:hypothetical protein
VGSGVLGEGKGACYSYSLLGPQNGRKKLRFTLSQKMLNDRAKKRGNSINGCDF